MSLQLRLWLTVVVSLLVGALVLVIGTSALFERLMLPFETVSAQSIVAVQAATTLHAAEAVEAATAAAIDPAVRSAARALAAGKRELAPDAEAALLGRAGTQGAPTFALLARNDGTIAAQAGESKLEGSLAGLPVFAEALTGLARDQAHAVDGVIWHLAGAPIYEGANLTAVVVLGWPYDGAFADRVTQQVGAPVIIIAAGERLGSALPQLTVEQLMVRGIGVGPLDVSPVPGPMPLLVPDKTRYSIIALPVFSGESVLAIAVVTDRNEALRALAYGQALVIVGTLLVALLQLLFIWDTIRSITQPIGVIVAHLSKLAQGSSVGILPEAALNGPFLRLGKQVNMLLQMMPSTSRQVPQGGSGSSAQLGFSSPSSTGIGLGEDPPFGSQAPRAVTPGTVPKPIAAAPSKVPSPAMDDSSGLSALFDDNAADPLAAFRVRSAPPVSRGQVPSSIPEAAVPAPVEQLPPEFFEPAAENSSEMSPEATVMFQVPQELLNQSSSTSTTTIPPSLLPAYAGNAQENDARTLVAMVPADLLAVGSGREGVTSADELHYREVYAKFLDIRGQCGEDTSDLTYDRFVAKLMKNRQQIVEKHKAKSVRFQVYVKEGKAALRALPVRE